MVTKSCKVVSGIPCNLCGSCSKDAQQEAAVSHESLIEEESGDTPSTSAVVFGALGMVGKFVGTLILAATVFFYAYTRAS